MSCNLLGVSVLFSLIIEAIKLGVPDLTETHPLEGIETNLVAWAVAALILSLAGDGFVAELATNRQGHPWVPHLGSQCGHSFHAVGKCHQFCLLHSRTRS